MPRGIVQRFDEHLHRSGLLAPGARLLVACSGGADSVALLRLLIAANGSRHWRFTIVVGHVNHGLRGRASAGDAAFVRRLARSLKAPSAGRTLRVQRTPGEHVGEAELRELRLAALVAMARKARCEAIVTAHHADDQAETVLMRMLRGTALLGLGGIPSSHVMGKRFVRPLLEFTRDELRAYLAEIGQEFREDQSNASEEYFRNRIRHEALPMLARLHPGVRGSLVRLAGHARASQELLESVAAGAMRRCRVRRLAGGRGVSLERAGLAGERAIVVGEVFRQIIENIGGTAASAERLAAAARAACGSHGAKAVELGGGLTMRVRGKRLEFSWQRKPKVP